MDEAFSRRFQSTIHFPMPSPEERLRLWQQAFSAKCRLENDIEVRQIARDYELSGGSVINVLRYCALSAIARGGTEVTRHELREGIRKELEKQNKTLMNGPSKRLRSVG